MKITEIRALLNTPKYDFLRTNEHLGNNIILLTVGGSHAYGLQNENSDVDLRGIATERLHEWIGLSNFEQFENRETDTTIFGFKKIVKLLLNCNPNVIELLATDDDMIFVNTSAGTLLRDNIGLFLSQKAANSFGGYATSQLRRIQNAMARDSYPQPEKEKHILGSVQNMMSHLKETYAEFTEDEIKIYIDDSDKEDYETEIFIDLNLKRFALRDLKNIQAEMLNVVKDYGKLTGRNKKAEEKLEKHAMHLIRLLLMGKEILEGRKVQTNRTNTPEYQLLLDVRSGAIPLKDVFPIIDEIEKDFQYAKKHSTLPVKPDFEMVEDLVCAVGKHTIDNYFRGVFN